MPETDRFIRKGEVEHLVGLKDSRIYQLIKAGDFPRPVKIGAASRWRLAAVQAWMDAKVAEAERAGSAA